MTTQQFIVEKDFVMFNIVIFISFCIFTVIVYTSHTWYHSLNFILVLGSAPSQW